MLEPSIHFGPIVIVFQESKLNSIYGIVVIIKQMKKAITLSFMQGIHLRT